MATTSAVSTGPELRDHVAAGAVIGSHTLQHLYGHAFWIVFPIIYSALGLTPIAAGLVGTVRSVGSGVSSTVGGFLIDRLQHRRLMILYISLAAMGLGYSLVGGAPTYVLILAALGLASVAGSVWHPTARGLLSQIYPRRRGFMLTVDRSAGALGDTAGPTIAGWLLVYLVWQGIFLAAFPLALLFMFILWTLLRRSETFQNVGARSRGQSRPFSEQVRDLRGLFRENSRILSLLILIKAIVGFGQGGLFLWLPLYLQESVGMGPVGLGFHLSLLTAMGIATSPAFGFLSDRIGRMPVIIIVLTAKVAITTLIALSGTGLTLTLLIGATGAFNMVQSAGADVGARHRSWTQSGRDNAGRAGRGERHLQGRGAVHDRSRRSHLGIRVPVLVHRGDERRGALSGAVHVAVRAFGVAEPHLSPAPEGCWIPACAGMTMPSPRPIPPPQYPHPIPLPL